MARITLKQVLGAGSSTHPVMAALAAAIGADVSVEDAAGRRLYGAALEGTRFPVIHDGCSLGWVTGPARAESIVREPRCIHERGGSHPRLGARDVPERRGQDLLVQAAGQPFDVGRFPQYGLAVRVVLVVYFQRVVARRDRSEEREGCGCIPKESHHMSSHP